MEKNHLFMVLLYHSLQAMSIVYNKFFLLFLHLLFLEDVELCRNLLKHFFFHDPTP